MWLLGNATSWLMFSIGVGLMLAILLRRYFRYYHRGGRRRSEQPLVVPTKPAKLEGQLLADAPPDLLRWQVEMHETARDLKAEIDSKLSALHALSNLADQAAERLEQAVARAEQLSQK